MMSCPKARSLPATGSAEHRPQNQIKPGTLQGLENAMSSFLEVILFLIIVKVTGIIKEFRKHVEKV